MNFGERLVELRKERGFMNRNDFANYIGMPSTTLRNYETNVREPGHIFLKQMSDIFHVSIDYLLCMTDDRTPPQKQTDFSALEVEHIKKYRVLDTHGKEMVNLILDKEYEKMHQVKNFLINKGGSLLHSLRDNLTVDELSPLKLNDDVHMLIEYLLSGYDFSRLSELDAIDFCKGFVLPMVLKSIRLRNAYQKDIRNQCYYLVQNMTNDIFNIINTSPIYSFDLGFLQSLIAEPDMPYLENDTLELDAEEMNRE